MHSEQTHRCSAPPENVASIKTGLSELQPMGPRTARVLEKKFVKRIMPNLILMGALIIRKTLEFTMLVSLVLTML